jgi:hypothetical protein
MTRSNVMAISETSALSTERTSRVSDACFNDWKRFCFVLREIASGEKGGSLSGAEAQRRARNGVDQMRLYVVGVHAGK